MIIVHLLGRYLLFKVFYLNISVRLSEVMVNDVNFKNA